MTINDVHKGYYYTIITPYFSGVCRVVGVSKAHNSIKVEYLVNGGTSNRVLPMNDIVGGVLLGGKDFAHVKHKGKISVGDIVNCGPYGNRRVKEICHFYGGCMLDAPEVEDGEAFMCYSGIINVIER